MILSLDLESPEGARWLTNHIEKFYSTADFVSKLRRLADALETGEKFEIQVANRRIYVPVRVDYNIEHEREDGSEEVECQINWEHE